MNICDVVAQSLREAPRAIDKGYIVVCGQISTAFMIAKEKGIRIRVRVMVGDATSMMITDVHHVWLEFVQALSDRPTGKSWNPVFRKIVGKFPLSIVTLGKIDGKDVEAWIGDVTSMETACTVCKRQYVTTVHAQRCQNGHCKDSRAVPNKAALITRTWDLLCLVDKQALLSQYRDFAKHYEGPVIDIVLKPDTMTGEDVCDALEFASDGTFEFPYGPDPVSDQLSFEDQIALLAYRVETTIVAHARFMELVGEKPVEGSTAACPTGSNKKSIKRMMKKFAIPSAARGFMDTFYAHVPENRFLKMLWLANVKGLNYDPERYLHYCRMYEEHAELELTPRDMMFDHVAAERILTAKIKSGQDI